MGNNEEMKNSPAHSAAPAKLTSVDELTRIFNTAIITSRSTASADLSSELYAVAASPAFRAILVAIKQLSQDQNLSLREAAEQVIGTFRKADTLWSEYIFQEGIDRVKGQTIRQSN